MVACHSGESPAAETAFSIGSEFESASMSYTEPLSGVASPGVGTPFSCLSCFFGLSKAEKGLVLRLGRASPLADMVVVRDRYCCRKGTVSRSRSDAEDEEAREDAGLCKVGGLRCCGLDRMKVETFVPSGWRWARTRIAKLEKELQERKRLPLVSLGQALDIIQKLNKEKE